MADELRFETVIEFVAVSYAQVGIAFTPVPIRVAQLALAAPIYTVKGKVILIIPALERRLLIPIEKA